METRKFPQGSEIIGLFSINLLLFRLSPDNLQTSDYRADTGNVNRVSIINLNYGGIVCVCFFKRNVYVCVCGGVC